MHKGSVEWYVLGQLWLIQIPYAWATRLDCASVDGLLDGIQIYQLPKAHVEGTRLNKSQRLLLLPSIVLRDHKLSEIETHPHVHACVLLLGRRGFMASWVSTQVCSIWCGK